MSENTFQIEDAVSEKTRYRDLVIRIWPFAAKYKWLLAVVLLIVLGHTIIGRILPNIIGYAVDHIILPSRLEKLAPVCMAYLGFEVLRLIFVFIETYLFQVLGQKIIYDLRSDLFAHIQKLPVSFFDKTPVGRLVTRVTNDFGSLADLFTAGLVSVFTDCLSIVAIVIAMALINLKLTVVVLAIGPLMFWGAIKLSEKARETLRQVKRRLAGINSFLAENISGIKIIQLYGRESKHREKFQLLDEEYKFVQLENIRYLAWLYPVLNAFNAMTIAAALYYGGFLNETSGLAIGSLIAFLTHVQDFLPPIRNIMEKYQTFQSSLASAERIFTLFDAPTEEYEGRRLELSRTMGQIEFRNVTFSYNDEAPEALKNLSFEITPGTSVAIVGSTGSGKSTIISCLQRFYEIDQTKKGFGMVCVDGLNIRKIDKRDLRRRIGVVQQDFFIFKGTIESNISLNDPRITDERIRFAALKANCEELLKSRGGLTAEVQEKGSNLSSGEKQLLNFARVLAFNPDILILDEATANIDSHNEALIQQATREVTKGRTSIIIAHRLSTILECDKILVLEKGELVQQGTHQDLVNQPGPYQKLYHSQLSHQLAH